METSKRTSAGLFSVPFGPLNVTSAENRFAQGADLAGVDGFEEISPRDLRRRGTPGKGDETLSIGVI